MPIIRHCVLDESLLSKRIYQRERHETISTELVIEQEIADELRRFLTEYLAFIGGHELTYLRIDAFPRDEYLDIIEVNVELREGWGIGLNLARASGNHVKVRDQSLLPKKIITYTTLYIEEFQLAQAEFLQLGHELHIKPWTHEASDRALEIARDDKIHLARFKQIWRGKHVRIPSMYIYPDVRYEELPEHVVFKFRQKTGSHASRCGYSVITRDNPNFGGRVRIAYEQGEMIAQHRMARTVLDDESVAQCIIMCAHTEPVTGYLQVAPPNTFVINDKSARKGPLVFA